MMHLQVEGKGGFAKLASKVRANGVTVLYHGSLAAWAATFVGHWPWFAVVRPTAALHLESLRHVRQIMRLCQKAH